MVRRGKLDQRIEDDGVPEGSNRSRRRWRSKRRPERTRDYIPAGDSCVRAEAAASESLRVLARDSVSEVRKQTVVVRWGSMVGSTLSLDLPTRAQFSSLSGKRVDAFLQHHRPYASPLD